MSKVGGVGLLPALCRRRTAWRLNVLRSRRNDTASSLACAAASRQTYVKEEPRSEMEIAAEPILSPGFPPSEGIPHKERVIV